MRPNRVLMRDSVIAATIAALMLILGGCGEKPPIAIEVKDACSQPNGTNVTVKGYFSLPKQLEVTKYTIGGQGAGINYKLILMTKQDATGDAVFVNMSGTVDPRPNKIKMLPDKYTWNDLVAYTDDNQTVVASNLVQLSGAVELSDKDKCKVNVARIEKL
ncbi:MAG: hypothetical protein AB7F88_14100 [Pyrinomonadaceae bacterium]